MLTLIKLLHTIIWAIMAGAILAIPVLSWRGRFRLAGWLSLLVLGECVVIGLNHGRCPLTDLAARFTIERTPNFDIYLPACLAQYNKTIFGLLFVAGEFIYLSCFVSRKASTESPQRSGVLSRR